MVGARARLDRLQEGARVRDVRAQVATGDLTAGVTLKVRQRQQLKSVPFWAQGDTTLYEEEVLERRMELRRDPLVREALEEWWVTVVNSLTSGGVTVEPEQCAISKEQYVLVCSRIYELLISGSFGARVQAAAEWDVDRKGALMMSRELWLDAIFECADTWTCGVSAEQYAAFLRHVLESVSFEIDVQSASRPATPATGLLTGSRQAVATRTRVFWRNPRRAAARPHSSGERAPREPRLPRTLPPRPRTSPEPVWQPTGPAPGIEPRQPKWAAQGPAYWEALVRLEVVVAPSTRRWRRVRELVLRAFVDVRRVAAMSRWRRTLKYARRVRTRLAIERQQKTAWRAGMESIGKAALIGAPSGGLPGADGSVATNPFPAARRIRSSPPAGAGVRVYGGGGGGSQPMKQASDTLASVAWAFADGGERSPALFAALLRASQSAGTRRGVVCSSSGAPATLSLPSLRARPRDVRVARRAGSSEL